MELNISGKTRLLGIIGNPIEHSFSPQLHNTISSFTGIDMVYVPFKVDKESLEDAVKGLKAINIVGFNVTIPFKKDVMRYIDDNTKEALLMGAVNTVKYIDGRFYGYNTDAEGFSRAFKEETKEVFKGKKIVVIGAGGAARAISVKLANEGAKEIKIINRTSEKANEISDIINNNIKNIASYFGLHSIKEVLEDSDIIINTTSIGMHPDIAHCPVPDDYEFKSHQIIYDAVYNPLETKLIKIAKEAGCKSCNGLGMLFYQGISAYEIWTGVKLGNEVLNQVYGIFKNILKIN